LERASQVHGKNNKRRVGVLLVAGMMERSGFWVGVILIMIVRRRGLITGKLARSFLHGVLEARIQPLPGRLPGPEARRDNRPTIPTNTNHSLGTPGLEPGAIRAQHNMSWGFGP